MGPTPPSPPDSLPYWNVSPTHFFRLHQQTNFRLNAFSGPFTWSLPLQPSSTYFPKSHAHVSVSRRASMLHFTRADMLFPGEQATCSATRPFETSGSSSPPSGAPASSYGQAETCCARCLRISTGCSRTVPSRRGSAERAAKLPVRSLSARLATGTTSTTPTKRRMQYFSTPQKIASPLLTPRARAVQGGRHLRLRLLDLPGSPHLPHHQSHRLRTPIASYLPSR